MPANWLWLFPLTYLFHILEEVFAGEGFYRWIGRVTGRTMTLSVFLLLNAAFLAAMVAAVMAAISGRFLVLVPALGTLTLLNGLGHLAGTLRARTYSPGLLTGLLLWAPLGAAALALSISYLSLPVAALGVALGFLGAGLVVFLGFTATFWHPGGRRD